MKGGGARRRLVRRRRVPNGCRQPVLRPEMSRRGAGAAGWGMGRDSASSAQSKRPVFEVGSGGCADSAYVASSGRAGNGGAGCWGAWGASLGVDGVVGDAGGVYHTAGGEAARLLGVWGELGGWNRLWGCSAGSSRVFRCSVGVVRGSGWGRAGDSAVVDERVDDDVAGRVDA